MNPGDEPAGRSDQEQHLIELLTREQRRAQRQRSVLRACTRVAHEQSSRGALELAAQEARTLLNARRAVVWTTREHARRESPSSPLSAEAGTPQSDEAEAVLPGVELLAQGRQRAYKLTERELEAHLSGQGADGARAKQLAKGGLLLAPLAARDGRLLGAIGAWSCCEGSVADDEGLALLQQLGDVTAAVVERSLLLEVAEHERTRAQLASTAKDEFLAMCSHELRTPLTAVLGWCQVLLTEGITPEQARKAARTIERNAKAQAELLEDLFDVSRIVTGKLRLERTVVDMRKVVQAALDATRPATAARTVRIDAHIAELPVLVHGDPVRLSQIVLNLLSNAIKFSKPGGSVVLCLVREEALCALSVRDEGVGIPPQLLPYIFDSFKQGEVGPSRKHGGLGLGLAIVRHLANAHGGSIEAFSEGVDKGSRFHVTLPLTQGAVDPFGEGPPTGAALTLPMSLEGVHVLVVDDEVDTRELLVSLFTHCKATVTAAANAEEGFVLACQKAPDILVSDIAMPGQNGYQLMENLRSVGDDAVRSIPAIAVTAYARAEDHQRALAAGFDMHMHKPIDPGRLVAAVASLAKRNARKQRPA